MLCQDCQESSSSAAIGNLLALRYRPTSMSASVLLPRSRLRPQDQRDSLMSSLRASYALAKKGVRAWPPLYTNSTDLSIDD
jgi:hypothetical protein